MARIPVSEEELIERFGPHLNEAPPGGWDAGLEVDRVVQTHCCFCGQQCGIKLKVRDDEVVGFRHGMTPFEHESTQGSKRRAPCPNRT